jgi:Protein of unknown function (DUF3800)
MPVTFVAYIDESGDTGLEQVKKPDDPKGATEWLVLSAFVVKIQHDSKMVRWVNDVQSDFTSKRQDLHFNKLLDFKKPLVCSQLAKKDCKGFVVMSNKKNIERYRNPNLDPSNKAWIYWFLARLLLERVTEYCHKQTPVARYGKDKLRIIFSRRGGLMYQDFADYLWKLYWQRDTNELVLSYRQITWPVIDHDEIFVFDHSKYAGLQLADVIAGAFFQAVEQNRGDAVACDPGCAKLLKPLIHFKGASWYLGVGLKTMPLLSEMDLTEPQKEIFTFYGAKKTDWQKKE